MSDFLLGIDIGTTSTKAVVIDSRGNLLAEASRPADLRSPQAGCAEEDPLQWWQNLAAIIPECLDRAGIRAGQIAAVGASGMVPTLILVDADGRVLRPSLQQNDARAIVEIEDQQRQTSAEDILTRTGSAITQQSIGPKLVWLLHHEPDILHHAAWVMGSYDYIAYHLTGAHTVERNWALESGLFDLQRQDWDDDLLSLAKIDRSWLGEVHWPAEIVGQVTPWAAGETGLKVGTPVVAGSADHIASAFSAGLKDEGDLLVKLGGAGDILCCVDRPEVDPRLFLDYHVIPGKFLVNGCMASSGSLIRWFRDQFAPGLEYSQLDAQAAGLSAGADGLVLLPYFLGEKTPINDPWSRGTLVGLTLSHTRAHVYRAVLEGIAYGFKHHLAVLAEHGHAAKRARVTNGGAHSRLWRQITADVLGVRLEEIAHHPGSSLGAAFIAGRGVGIFQDWSEIERFIRIEAVTEPDLENYARYQGLFTIYRQVYENLKTTYPELVRLAEPSQPARKVMQV
jgi:xylulokinase